MMRDPQQQLIEQGRDWYHDRIAAIQLERNRYFAAFIFCLILLALALVVLILLMPLKTAVPYVIEIDKSTGITTVVKPLDAQSLRAEQAVTTYFLMQYLNARMSYDWGLRQTNANIVQSLSTAHLFAQYAAQMDIHNPESPIHQYGDNNVVNVHVNSYSYPYANTAEIHFYTENTNKTSPSSQPLRQHWVAVIKYTYANNPLPARLRETINPLGFFVTDFQLNQDIPTAGGQ